MYKNLDWYIKSYKLIPDDVCDSTIAHISKDSWKQHTFYSVSDNTMITRSGDKELDISYDYPPEHNFLMDCVWKSYENYFGDCNFSWHSKWNGFSDIRYNKYKETRVMAEHVDHIHSLFPGEPKGIPVLSALGCLNDDYAGGELVFFGDTVVPFEKGTITVFPSNFLYPHRVDPVLSGTRYSFICWSW